MKNITFSADERLIELARLEAMQRRTTLNGLFREWLAELAGHSERSRKADQAMRAMSRRLRFDRRPSRDELHER